MTHLFGTLVSTLRSLRGRTGIAALLAAVAIWAVADRAWTIGCPVCGGGLLVETNPLGDGGEGGDGGGGKSGGGAGGLGAGGVGGGDSGGGGGGGGGIGKGGGGTIDPFTEITFDVDRTDVTKPRPNGLHFWASLPACFVAVNPDSCQEDAPVPLLPGPAPVKPAKTAAPNGDGMCEDEATGMADRGRKERSERKQRECDTRADVNRYGGDHKVLPFNGQEMFDETDLVIPGRDPGVDVRLQRRHLSGVTQADPHLGPAWALSYVHTFQAIDPAAAASGDVALDLRMTTFGRTDRFGKVAPNIWEGRDGRFDRLVYDGRSDALMVMPGGTILHFEVWRRQDPGQPLKIFGQLRGFQSPKGNMVRIRLDASAANGAASFAIPRRILSIQDSFGRSIVFNYEDPRNRNLVTRIVDFSGRQVRYVYSCTNQLLRATTPAVASTGGVNDFPEGKTTRYTYYGSAAAAERGITLPAGNAQFTQQDLDRFRVSLESVTAPNQSTSGSSRLSWTYYVEPGGDRHGRVKTHTVGNTGATPSAGGTYQYDYQLFKPATADANTRVSKATVLDRRGTRTELEYSAWGHLLKETVFTAGARSGEPPSFTRSFTYNRDGELISYVDANGIRTMYSLSDDGTTNRAGSRNEIAREILPAPGKAADQPKIRTERVYEPLFNRVFKEIDPRGFEPGNDPDDFTTTYIYSYMEDLDTTIAVAAPLMAVTEESLRAQFEAFGIQSVGDVNGDAVTRVFTDNIVKIIHPRVALPADASRIGLSTTQETAETFTYNKFGQRIRHVDAEGNITTWEYYPANDPDGDGVIDRAGEDTTTGGYLKRMVADAETGAGRNSGQNPMPVAQATLYEYTAQGSFPANPRGVPTAIVDPRGIRDTFLVNERDQIVKRVRAARVTESPQTGLTPFAYEDHTLYDANDNVVELRIQNKDTLEGGNDFIRHRFEYDVLDQRTAEVWDVGGLAIRNEYVYDPSQNLRALTRGAGSAEASVTKWLYDQRDILFSMTRGSGSPDESIMKSEIDDNGNITAWIDGDGDRTEIVYDGYDREKEVIDRVRNRTVHTYDSASNRIRTIWRGPAVPLGPEVTLAQTDWKYDTRNRMFREDRALFDTEGIATLDPGDLQVRSPSSSNACSAFDGCVSRLVVHDRLNRVVAEIDGDDDLSEHRYDGLSRLILEKDPLGNETVRTYDANDNLTTVTDVERSPLVRNPESFGTLVEFDSLDRPVRRTEPGGQLTTFTYDSRDNLIRRADGHRNQTEWRHDRLDRVLEERRYLAPLVAGNTARDASATRLNPTQGGGDGRIDISFAYDDLHRVITRTDDNGKVTEHFYDTLDRTTGVLHPDGTEETLTYSDDDEPLTQTTQNGSVVTWVHDAAERPVQLTVDNSGAPGIRGTTSRIWGYDGLSRVVTTLDDNGAEPDVTVRRFYDSLSRRVRETQAITGYPSLSVDEQWKAENQRVLTVYPNGRQIRSVHDQLDREARIEEGSQAIGVYDYVGAWRDVRITLGNGAVLDLRNSARTQTTSGTKPGYDRNRRNVRRRWTQSGGALIAGYGAAYNDVHVLMQENRDHFGRGDRMGVDSAGRLTYFRHNAPLSGEALGALEGDTVEAARTSSWLLDGAHNWKTYVQRDVSRSPVIDTAGGVNEYASFDGMPQTFDADGNLTSDGTRTYSYDFGDRLVEARTPAGASLGRYVYDADGRRVLKITPSSTTRYVYRGWEAIEERDATNAVVQQYVYRWGIDRPVQLRKPTGTGAGTYYYHDDTRGNVGALTNASQAVVYRTEYDAWGGGSLGGSMLVSPTNANVFLGSDPIANPLLWQARRLDSETGLYYYRHRYYDPKQGRFIQPDPIGSWGDPLNVGNRYAFTGNVFGPKDPLGLQGGSPDPNDPDFEPLLIDRFLETRAVRDALQDKLRPHVEASRFVGEDSCDPRRLPVVEESEREIRNRERKLVLAPDTLEAMLPYIEASSYAGFGFQLAASLVSPDRVLKVTLRWGLPKVALRSRPPALLPRGTPNRAKHNAAARHARERLVIEEGREDLIYEGIKNGAPLVYEQLEGGDQND